MSVIGRLDDQVDEILIAPLQRKNNREAKEQEAEQPSSREATQIEPDPSTENVATHNELPVWLL
ncbi:MAG TPA: hypothetical protein VGN95_20530 [Pyrinomonadaceae bacterium]|jgi:hypothetical protein|nr:hypothetical protein [Pyrinomonadaceae bacterium]